MTFVVKEIETKQNVKVYGEYKCDGCYKDIKVTFCDQEVEYSRSFQPDDALIVKLDGGYGCAIDPMCEDDYKDLTKIFCKKCLKKLCLQWPTFFAVIRNGCSSTIGHHCSKTKKFSWKNSSNCCRTYCSKCGDSGGYYVQQNENGRYLKECYVCKTTNEFLFGWEVKKWRFVVALYNVDLAETTFLGNYKNKAGAEKLMEKYKKLNPAVKEDCICVEKLACI